MTGLILRGVTKSFGKTPVLSALDLTVLAGQFCVVVGPSGCGKSTLLRLVAGLETPDSGQISIAGHEVTRLPPSGRKVSMVFQNYALLPHLSVARNIALGMEIRGEGRSEIDRKVRDTAALLRLTDHLAKKPRALSGGQRQRVAMGRAIVREPDLFLFDEPLSNLDAQLRGEMRLEIRTLQQRLGTTTLYVTHDQIEAMTMGDVLVVMNGGKVEQIGAPLDLYSRPANTFVARFIGAPSMNLMPAQVRARRLCSALGEMPVDLPDGPVQLGIRPEHLHPTPDADAQFRVRLVEPHGADTFLHGHVGTEPILARLPGGLTPKPGAQMPLRADPAALHVFSPEGLRLN